MAESASRTRAEPITLSFEAGDEHHGDQMSAIDNANLYHWLDKGHELIAKASRGNSATKRMLWELRNINKAEVPFVSATEIEDDVSRILASIEGPPNTPYEGGIFWILVLASTKTPPEAPTLRFLTKIYHPNIDHRTGKLCADYQQKWNPSKVSASVKGHLGESATLWSERTSPNQWTLLALLIAICALLASPNAEDPLIPEIVQKFVEDPQGYYEAAKMWTKRYATPEMPELPLVEFPEAPSLRKAVDFSESILEEQEHIGESSLSAVELMEYLRWRFEEKYISNAVLCVRKLSTWSTATENSTLEAVITDFLGRDRPQLRQITLTESGERLSDIEQWRIAREIRLEARKHMEHYSPEKSGRFFSLHESQIRRAIHNSFVESFGGTKDNGNYLGVVKKSFFNCSRNSERIPLQKKRISSSSTPVSHFKYTKAYYPQTQSRRKKHNHCPPERNHYPSPRNFPFSYYATSTDIKEGGSSPPVSPARRRSYSQRALEDPDEYVEYLEDGIIYRVPLESQSTSRYSASDWLRHTESQTAQSISPSRARRQSSSTEQRPISALPTTAPKQAPSTPKATEADARKHRILPGFSLKHWDPSEEPIKLLGSVFDANSLGKWIYEWTVYHHGPRAPIADMAGEPWLLLIQLAGKVKRAEETIPRIRAKQNREMVKDFIESEERLTRKLKKLLESCEAPMLKTAKKNPTGQPQLGKDAGKEFIDNIFGRDRQLDSTEKFMSSIRLWNLRFDANCEDILRRPEQAASDKYTSTQNKFVMTSVEDIFEDDDEA